MADLLHPLDALGPNGPYRARVKASLTDVSGAAVAELSLVPQLFVHRSMAALRRAQPLTVEQRAGALARAADAFACATLAGLSVEEYEYRVSRVCGVPLPAVRNATRATARSMTDADRIAHNTRPVGAVERWDDPSTRHGHPVWLRRGDVFAVNAAGNHPGVQALWIEALALGYRLAVRPSQREPYTAHRLVTALRDAGFGTDHVVLLPTDHTLVDDLVRGADFAVVYGSDIAQRYIDNPRVLPQGPGRSKILLTEDSWQSHLDLIVDSVCHDGGTTCVNTTAVLLRGDHHAAAAAIAERLATLPDLPPHDDKAMLPVQPLDAARAIEEYLLRQAEGAQAYLGGEGIVADLGDGSAVLRPAVFALDRPDAPQLAIELPFPCVWVAPWSPSDGIGPLRDTLALTVITEDNALVDRLVAEPGIGKVQVGAYPTHWMGSDTPHDGYLAEFLMRTKAVVRD